MWSPQLCSKRYSKPARLQASERLKSSACEVLDSCV